MKNIHPLNIYHIIRKIKEKYIKTELDPIFYPDPVRKRVISFSLGILSYPPWFYIVPYHQRCKYFDTFRFVNFLAFYKKVGRILIPSTRK